MGLEKLKSIFQTGLDGNIKKFKQTTVTNVNGTNFFNEPPQPTIHIATNPTDFSTANGNNNLPYTPLTFNNNGTTFFNTPPRPTQFLATNPTDFSTAVGNNDSAFTPLSQLGQSALDGLSWESLYNSNHTPLNNPQHKGLSVVNYGPNVNRDKLDIRNNQSRVSIFSPSRTQLLGFGAGEPYMVSEIPTSDGSMSGGRLMNFGSQDVPIVRAVNDGIRLGKYLSSPSGLLFIAKQNLLGLASKSEAPLLQSDGGHANTMVSPQRFNTFYNPLSTLGAAAGRLVGPQPNVLIRKDTLLPGTLGTQKSYGVGGGSTGGVSYDVNISFTGGDGLLSPITDASTSFPIAAGVKFKTPGLRSGDAMTLADMITGVNLDSTGITTVSTDENGLPSGGLNNPFVNVEKVQNGMPFYFKDLRDNTYIFFRAYIEGLSENISPGYNPTQYIGRSEPVYTYSSTEREISMTLKLFAQTKDELSMIYKKMNKLTSLCYPEYFEDEGVSYGNRMKAPLTKLRIGEMFGNNNSELQGYVKSLSYSVDQSSPYETEVGKRVPKYVTATIGYQVIHSSVPNLETKFYGYIGD